MAETKIDTLVAGIKKFQAGAESNLYELVGKGWGSFLLDVARNKEIKSDLPWGIKSTIKPGDYNKGFRDRKLSLIKEDIFKGLDAKLEAERNKLMLKVSTEF